MNGTIYGRAGYLGEICPINVDVAFDVLAHVNYFVANIFALSIAIGPNDELLAAAHFALKRSLDWFVVLGAEFDDGRVK